MSRLPSSSLQSHLLAVRGDYAELTKQEAHQMPLLHHKSEGLKGKRPEKTRLAGTKAEH
jgi:hypothetical protein